MSKSIWLRVKDLFQTKKIVLPPYLVEGYEQTGSYTDMDDADRQVFDQLIELGADLSKKRHCIHYLYFPTEDGAQKARQDLKGMRFKVKVGKQVPSEPEARQWPISAEHTEVINMEVIRALRKPLTAIAENYDGEYDGWEAAAT